MMLAIFGSFAALFILVERLARLRPQPFVRSGFAADVAYVAIHYVFRVVINGTIAVALAAAGRRTLPAGVVGALSAQPVWVQTVVLLLVLDFLFYVTHRLKHRWTWWWRLHETHHSSTELDWLSTARFHPLEKILDRTLFLLPLLVIGPSDTAILIWASCDAFFGMFIHANITWRLGPLIYIFTGPEMHRWHHALDRERRDCNYGNNFSIFDWMFGTAYLTDERPTRFGVDAPDYPATNLFRQFTYAFRREAPERSTASATPRRRRESASPRRSR